MKRAVRVRDRQDDLAFGGEDSGVGVDGVDAVTVDEESLARTPVYTRNAPAVASRG